MDMTTIGQIFGYTAAFAGSGIIGYFALRRRLSRDGVELTKDRAEIDVIEQITKQRDKAILEIDEYEKKLEECLSEKTLAQKEVETLRNDIEKLKHKIILLEKLCANLSQTLDMTKEELKKIVEEDAKKNKAKKSQE